MVKGHCVCAARAKRYVARPHGGRSEPLRDAAIPQGIAFPDSGVALRSIRMGIASTACGRLAMKMSRSGTISRYTDHQMAAPSGAALHLQHRRQEMRSKWLFGAALLAVVGTTPAAAQWTYEFSGNLRMNHDQYHDDDLDEDVYIYGPQQLTFTLTTISPITANGWHVPDTCSIAPAMLGGNTYSCSDQEFQVNFEGYTDSNGDFYHFIGASYTHTGGGGGGGFFFFEPGAFWTVGTYTQIDLVKRPNPAFDGIGDCADGHEWDDPCVEFLYAGSAGPGTLTVRFGQDQTPGDVVPEPATMTLLATGLAGVAAARRRRLG